MNKEKSQAGLAPFIIIAIVAVLAIGGGAYVVTKNKAAKTDTSADVELGAKAKGSLRSLMGAGKNVMCTFTDTTPDGMNASGTTYVAADGRMRGDFTGETEAGTQTSSMIFKDGYSYAWYGGQGVKAAVEQKTGAELSAGSDRYPYADISAEVDYSCSDWEVDESKFSLPADVEFIDLEAMLKASGAVGPGNINIENATELGY